MIEEIISPIDTEDLIERVNEVIRALNNIEVQKPALNKISLKLLCDLKRVLPKVKNGMRSETIHDIRGVIADCIARINEGKV